MGTVLSRRELLSRSSVLLLLVPIARTAVGCSSSSNAPSSGACDGVLTTSTVTANHTHTLCVPSTDLSSPPAGGMTYTTSTTGNHSHTVTLTQQQLQSINGGGQVTVTSSAPAAHDFAIKKA